MKRWIALALIALPSAADAAPRTPYGSEVLAYVFGRPLNTSPQDLATPADATLQFALYERLYRLNEEGALVGVLASGPPVVEGRRVTVPIRTDVMLHDGRVLTATMVANALGRLVTSTSRAAYVGALVTGAEATFDGKNPPLGIRATRSSVVFDLRTEHPDFARVLASAHASVVVPATGRAGLLGTGPFSFVSRGARGEIAIAAFTAHRDGRPFVDGVRFRPHASRFGAAALAKEGAPAFVFGVPDTTDAVRRGTLEWPNDETLVLAIGPRFVPASSRAKVVLAVDGALNRRRLVARYLDKDATVARRLLDFRAESSSDGAVRAEQMNAAILVSRDARAGHRLAERIQLDLLRAGITVRIERLSPSRLEERRRSGDYELLLDTVVSGAPATSNPSDRLHGLMSIAAAMGRPGAITSEQVAAFVSSVDKDRALSTIEGTLRVDLGLVPIAKRRPAIVADPNLERATIDPSGALDLANAYRGE